MVFFWQFFMMRCTVSLFLLSSFCLHISYCVFLLLLILGGRAGFCCFGEGWNLDQMGGRSISAQGRGRNDINERLMQTHKDVPFFSPPTIYFFFQKWRTTSLFYI